MGAVSPAPALTAELTEEAWREVVEKTIAGMRAESMPYQGFLYAGLMLTADGIKVIEFNCRFGDPEAQAILPRIKGDLLAAMFAASQGNLGGNLEKTSLSLQDNVAVVVVMANQGYPEKAVSGAVINGLAESAPNTLVFHAGTTQAGADIIASGGRVLAVTGWARIKPKREKCLCARWHDCLGWGILSARYWRVISGYFWRLSAKIFLIIGLIRLP